MRFKDEESAWKYWEEVYYMGSGYEGVGLGLDMRVVLFKEWAKEEDIVWGEEDLWKGVFE